MKLKLEVIADDMLFQPWSNDFVAENSIKVETNLVENEISKPTVSVLLKESKLNKYIKDVEYVIKEAKKIKNLSKKQITEIINKYANARGINNSKERIYRAIINNTEIFHFYYESCFYFTSTLRFNRKI